MHCLSLSFIVIVNLLERLPSPGSQSQNDLFVLNSKQTTNVLFERLDHLLILVTLCVIFRFVNVVVLMFYQTESSCSLMTSSNMLNKVISPKKEQAKKTQADDVTKKQSEKNVTMNDGKSSPNVNSVRQAFAVNQLHLANGKQLVAKIPCSDERNSPDKKCSKQNQIGSKLRSSNFKYVQSVMPTSYKSPLPGRKNNVQRSNKQISPKEKSVGVMMCSNQSAVGKKSVYEMQLGDEQSSLHASVRSKQIVCNTLQSCRSPIKLSPVYNEKASKSHKLAVTEVAQKVGDATKTSATVLTATDIDSPKYGDWRNDKECTRLENSGVNGLVEPTLVSAELSSADADESSAIFHLYGLNMANWFEDDFCDGGEVAVISGPVNNAIDSVNMSRSSAAKTGFLLPRDSCAFIGVTDSERCRLNKPLQDVTNTASKSIDGHKATIVKRGISGVSSGKTPLMKSSSSPRSCSGVRITPVANVRQLNNCPSVRPLSAVNACFKPPVSIAGELRTPVAPSSCSLQGLTTPMNWQTPSNATPMSNSGVTLMKKTPPLCDCGCRSKRKLVQRPGPNLGRSFFCCGSSSMAKSSCKFFKWEINVTSPASSSSCNSFLKNVTPSSSGIYTSFSSSIKFGVTPVSVRPRFVSVTRVLVPPN